MKDKETKQVEPLKEAMDSMVKKLKQLEDKPLTLNNAAEALAIQSRFYQQQSANIEKAIKLKD